jgi:hypothetical protein
MARGMYIKRRCFVFPFQLPGQIWPYFRSLSFISPLIRKINRALGRDALLIFESVSLSSSPPPPFFLGWEHRVGSLLLPTRFTTT